tara:strand:+ start:532 stop:1104 length:573 start_codon:yes stop_codon:yes gene_type:complete
MSNDDDYDDYSDEDGDDIHAECVKCGTLNRFPGKDIPRILCYECGEIVDAPPPEENAPAVQMSVPATTPQAAKSSTNTPSSSESSVASNNTYASVASGKKEKEKKGFFKRRSSKKKFNQIAQASTEGNPTITAPICVKHVSGATSRDVAPETHGLQPSGDVSIKVDVKSTAMNIPVGLETKPLEVRWTFF